MIRVWMSKDVLSGLEPYDGKLSRTVLRGVSSPVTGFWAGNGPRLLDSYQGQALRSAYGHRS
jgi:hypothetical protein